MGRKRADSEVYFTPPLLQTGGCSQFVCGQHTNNASLLEGMVTLQNHKFNLYLFRREVSALVLNPVDKGKSEVKITLVASEIEHWI